MKIKDNLKALTRLTTMMASASYIEDQAVVVTALQVTLLSVNTITVLLTVPQQITTEWGL